MLTITNLGHASFLIKNDDISLVIDPYQDNSVPGLKMPRVEANYVFCSHDHYDHCAKELVKAIPTNSKVNFKTIHTVHDHHNGAHRGLNNMHLFEMEGYRILHTGDLGCIPCQEVLDQMKNVDILLAPINGHFTISSEELFEIIKLVQPRLTIPMHYYKKEDNSGYPDGNQIDVFKRLVGLYAETDSPSIVVNDDLLKNKILLFKKSMGDLK